MLVPCFTSLRLHCTAFEEVQIDAETFITADTAALEKYDISPERCADLKLSGSSGTDCGVNTTVPHSAKVSTRVSK